MAARVGPASRRSGPKVDGDEGPDLENVATEMRQLEIGYVLFFTGRRARPPIELRSRVETLFRRWDGVRLPTFTRRFRFTTLQ
ncbi:MAG: hypothetical protein VYE68_00135 [Acidobacteriota bacterium]|nr:hypothetical protein [Acidobacteriota bacterium]